MNDEYPFNYTLTERFTKPHAHAKVFKGPDPKPVKGKKKPKTKVKK